MPRSFARGSTGAPLLADYLRLNEQQGAQQAGQVAQGLAQQGQQARAAVDDATAHVSLSRLGSTGEVSPYEAQRALARPDVDLAGADVDTTALTRQVNRAATAGGLAGSVPGIGTLNALRYGTGAPHSAGGSMFDAAVANNAGGRQIRAAARPMGTLMDYMGGAAKRGNEAAVTQAQHYLVPPTPKPPSSAQPPPMQRVPAVGRPNAPENSGQTPTARDYWRQQREENEPYP